MSDHLNPTQEALRVMIMETLSSSVVAFHRNLDTLALLARTLPEHTIHRTVLAIKEGLTGVMRGVHEEVIEEHVQEAVPTPEPTPTVELPKKFERPEATPRPHTPSPQADLIDQALLSAKDALAMFGQAKASPAAPEPVMEEPLSVAQRIDAQLDRLFSPQLRLHGTGKYCIALENESAPFALPVLQGSLRYMRLKDLLESHQVEALLVIDQERFSVVFKLSETSFLVIDDLQGQPEVSIRNPNDQVIFDTTTSPDSVLQHLAMLEKNQH